MDPKDIDRTLQEPSRKCNPPPAPFLTAFCAEFGKQFAGMALTGFARARF